MQGKNRIKYQQDLDGQDLPGLPKVENDQNDNRVSALESKLDKLNLLNLMGMMTLNAGGFRFPFGDYAQDARREFSARMGGHTETEDLSERRRLAPRMGGNPSSKTWKSTDKVLDSESAEDSTSETSMESNSSSDSPTSSGDSSSSMDPELGSTGEGRHSKRSKRFKKRSSRKSKSKSTSKTFEKSRRSTRSTGNSSIENLTDPIQFRLPKKYPSREKNSSRHTMSNLLKRISLLVPDHKRIGYGFTVQGYQPVTKVGFLTNFVAAYKGEQVTAKEALGLLPLFLKGRALASIESQEPSTWEEAVAILLKSGRTGKKIAETQQAFFRLRKKMVIRIVQWLSPMTPRDLA